MASVPRERGLPCHRVVRSDGSLTKAFGAGEQCRLLEREGVLFTPDGRADMGRCHWDRGEAVVPGDQKKKRVRRR